MFDEKGSIAAAEFHFQWLSLCKKLRQMQRLKNGRELVNEIFQVKAGRLFSDLERKIEIKSDIHSQEPMCRCGYHQGERVQSHTPSAISSAVAVLVQSFRFAFGLAGLGCKTCPTRILVPAAIVSPRSRA